MKLRKTSLFKISEEKAFFILKYAEFINVKEIIKYGQNCSKNNLLELLE